LAAKVFDNIESVALNNVVFKNVSKKLVAIKLLNVRKAMNISGTPKHINESKIIRRRLSSAFDRAARDEDTCSKCLQTHIVAIGSANDAPTTIFVAGQGE
jgi:hypothetical protein